eukprot:m.206505 g.206505  ORF g.206505 m.206505 type:complete len:513 (-) comp15027_c1_seq1:254-1792(-)
MFCCTFGNVVVFARSHTHTLVVERILQLSTNTMGKSIRVQAGKANRQWNVSIVDSGNGFITEDGLRLHRVEMRPNSFKDGKPANGLVFFAHGYAEHVGRYEPLMRLLALNNFVVVGHDHAGHGRSEGEFMDVKSFDVYTRDLNADIDATQRRFPGLKTYVAGSSLGGLMACRGSLESPRDGLVLIAPLVQMDPATATPCKLRLVSCCARRCPNFAVGKLDMDWITRNKDALKKTKADKQMRLNIGMKARFAALTLDAIDDMEQRIPELSLPMLVLHGAADKITSTSASESLVQTVSSSDATCIVYPEAYHDLLHELDDVVDKVQSDIVSWLLAHATGSEFVRSSSKAAAAKASEAPVDASASVETEFSADPTSAVSTNGETEFSATKPAPTAASTGVDAVAQPKLQRKTSVTTFGADKASEPVTVEVKDSIETEFSAESPPVPATPDQAETEFSADAPAVDQQQEEEQAEEKVVDVDDADVDADATTRAESPTPQEDAPAAAVTSTPTIVSV